MSSCLYAKRDRVHLLMEMHPCVGPHAIANKMRGSTPFYVRWPMNRNLIRSNDRKPVQLRSMLLKIASPIFSETKNLLERVMWPVIHALEEPTRVSERKL